MDGFGGVGNGTRKGDWQDLRGPDRPRLSPHRETGRTGAAKRLAEGARRSRLAEDKDGMQVGAGYKREMQDTTYVRLMFPRGVALDEPAWLFNAGFGGGTRRPIDIPEGYIVYAMAFKALVRPAIGLNVAKQKQKPA
jgi:hypothetical protein